MGGEGRTLEGSKRIIHPEQRKAEIYLGNFDTEGFKEVGYDSKRMGGIAYNDEGEPVDHCSQEGFYPVFVSKKEYQRNIS